MWCLTNVSNGNGWVFNFYSSTLNLFDRFFFASTQNANNMILMVLSIVQIVWSSGLAFIPCEIGNICSWKGLNCAAIETD